MNSIYNMIDTRPQFRANAFETAEMALASVSNRGCMIQYSGKRPDVAYKLFLDVYETKCAYTNEDDTLVIPMCDKLAQDLGLTGEDGSDIEFKRHIESMGMSMDDFLI